jgi:hypothetical protein
VDESSEHAARVADIAWRVADEALGATPVIRRRDGSLRIVMFLEHEDRTPPIHKVRRTYQTPDEKTHTIELLASGQQVVIEGPHAKGQNALLA